MLRINGVDYSACYLVGTEEGQALLKEARNDKFPVVCACNLAKAPRMAIKKWERGSYFLARFPDSAQDHDTCCPSYESPGKAVERRQALKGVAAIVEDLAGHFYINLSEPLAEATPTEQPGAPMQRHGCGEGGYQAATTLAATCLFFLEQGGLASRQSPDQVGDWNHASRHIDRQVTAKTWIRGQPTRSVLMLPRRANESRTTDVFNQLHMAWDRNEKPYKLVMGRVKRVEDLDEEHVSIELEDWVFDVVMSKTRWQAAIRYSVSANTAAAVGELVAKDPESRVMILALVKPGNSRMQVLANTAALVVTNRAFMPVASQPELAVANRLFAGAGHIDKPMRPHADFLWYMPDFVLTMPGKRTLLMEVAGLNDVAYLTHLKEKIEAYDGEGLAIWVWFVDAELMPPFTPQSLASVLARLDALLDVARLQDAKKATSGSDVEAA